MLQVVIQGVDTKAMHVALQNTGIQDTGDIFLMCQSSVHSNLANFEKIADVVLYRIML